jgi:hypothetical protein
VRIVGADKSNIYNFMWSGNSQPIAKMIIVNGKIIAIGTKLNPITFDRNESEPSYRWGSIYMAPSAPMSTFEYCIFRHANFCDYVPGDWALAALEFANGVIRVRDCTFDTNLQALRSMYLSADLLIYRCTFRNSDNEYPPPFAGAGYLGFSAAPSPEPPEHYKVTIAKCYFTGNATRGPTGYYMDILFLNNVMDNYNTGINRQEESRNEYGTFSSYGNTTINGDGAWGCTSYAVTDTVFARRNRFVKPINANPGNSPLLIVASGYGTSYVSDNYLYGSVQAYSFQTNATTTYMYNNIIETNYSPAIDFDITSTAHQDGQMRFFNNLVRYIGSSTPYVYYTDHASPFMYNNTFVNFHTFQGSVGDCDPIITNNIIDVSYRYGTGSEAHHPTFYHNCLSIPIPTYAPYTDGGGNVVDNPAFADTLNGDYSLHIGSRCIDAGAYRPDLPEFDIRYHKRIVPAFVGVPSVIDIGAYEYNSVYIGGLRGYVYDSFTGLPVDCVKLEIEGKLPEFSDSLGWALFPTGAGVYTLKASRWDYADTIIPIVAAYEGEETVLNIPMVRVNVANDDEVTPNPGTDYGLSNYPNPFNPETTVSFILPSARDVTLSIYNLRGQKVKTLHEGLLPGGFHRMAWNGTDSQGKSVGSGLYFAKLEDGKHSQTRKLMLMK